MTKRNSGIDLLRLVAMFLVVCLHILVQGGVVGTATGAKGIWLGFLQSLAACAVNVYGLTTGYLLCRRPFRLKRLTGLWLTTVFWSVAVSCVCFLVFPETAHLSEAVSMFLPLLRGRYWYFTAYLVVAVLSPVLNLVLRTLPEKKLRLFLLAVIALLGLVPIGALGNDVLRISGGHHFAWLAVLYLLGGYFRIHGTRLRVRAWWFFLPGILNATYQAVVTAVGLGAYRELLMGYPSPLILGEAVCLLLALRRVKQIPGWIPRPALAGVWAVYVIHAHPLLYWNERVIGWFRAWDNLNVPAVTAALVLTAVGITAICLVLEWLRRKLFAVCGIDRAVETLSDRLEKTLRRWWKG